MIANPLGTLACNPFEGGVGINDVTASVIKTAESISRNCFIISKIPTEKYRDDIVRYGDNFSIQTCDSLRLDFRTNVVKPPFYLSSALKQSDRLAKRSREQEVYFSLDYTTNCMFKIIPRDTVKRGIDEGKPVIAETPIAIYHVKSNQAIACDKQFDIL